MERNAEAGPPAAASWLVDGMNVIGSRPDGWWRDRPAAMRRLVERLGEHVKSSGEAITVVFDGRPVALDAQGAGLTVAFADRRGPNAADDAIVEHLRAMEPAARPTVVTSDADLARRARALGAPVASAGAFLGRLKEERSPPA